MTGLSASSKAYEPLEALIREYIWVGFIWFSLCSLGFLWLRPVIFTVYHIHGIDYVIGILSLMLFHYAYFVMLSAERLLTFANTRAVIIANLVQLLAQVLITFYLVVDYGFLGAIFARISGSLVCALICWCFLKSSKSKMRVFGYF